MNIAEAMNTWSSALLVLLELGYTLGSEFNDDDECSGWWASQGETRLHASNPLALLGLASLVQARGERWGPTPEGHEIYERLLAGQTVDPKVPESDRGS